MSRFLRAREHFIDRVKGRYNVRMSFEEYNELLQASPIFQGMYSKNATNTVGFIIFKEVKIYCLYNRRLGIFTTAYPSTIETDINDAIKTCFARPVRELAYELYAQLLEHLNAEPADFESEKDAAIYYFANSNFPTMLIERFKFGEIRPLKICHEIRKIINGEHLRVTLAITKKVSS